MVLQTKNSASEVIEYPDFTISRKEGRWQFHVRWADTLPPKRIFGPRSYTTKRIPIEDLEQYNSEIQGWIAAGYAVQVPYEQIKGFTPVKAQLPFLDLDSHFPTTNTTETPPLTRNISEASPVERTVTWPPTPPPCRNQNTPSTSASSRYFSTPRRCT